nr:cupin domain-containing protein [uncultured Flavobacterium sp.]
MKNEKKLVTTIIAFFLFAIYTIPSSAQHNHPAVSRTELQRHDMSTPATEMVQARIDFESGTSFGNHKHPGEEIIYVIEGTFEYQIEGKQPVTLKAGEVLFIPAGTIHSAKNVGSGKASELATYIVKKGEPLVQLIR